jgi:biopolymer transport protein ExbD
LLEENYINPELRWVKNILDARDRLTEGLHWFPYPALISIGFLLIFSGHILFNLNPRIGSQSTPIILEGSTASEGSIWMAVLLRKDKLVITTDSKQIFQWNADKIDKKELEPFIAYLKAEKLSLSFSALLAKRIQLIQTLVVMAVDQQLNYAQVRPLLYALSQAGISHYAFEVKKPLN